MNNQGKIKSDIATNLFDDRLCFGVVQYNILLEKILWESLRRYLYKIPSSYGKFHKECYKALLRYLFTEKSFAVSWHQQSTSVGTSKLTGLCSVGSTEIPTGVCNSPFVLDFNYPPGIKKLEEELHHKCETFEVPLQGSEILASLIKIRDHIINPYFIIKSPQYSAESLNDKTVEFRPKEPSVAKKGKEDTMVVLTRGPLTVELRKSVYQKLVNDYRGDKVGGNILKDIMKVAIRYQLISDVDLDTYHWAIRPTAVAAFNEKIRAITGNPNDGISHECFASPLNHSSLVSSYSSPFLDSDVYFGSKGNIFNYLNQVTGLVMANPPFLEEIQDRFVDCFLYRLGEADRMGQVFGGIIIYPKWDDARGNVALKASPYLITRAIPSSIADKERRESIFGFMSYNTGIQFSMGQHWQEAIDKVEFFLLLNHQAQRIYGRPEDFFVF